MIPEPGVTFGIMGVIAGLIILWSVWSRAETHPTTAEIIAESRRKHGLDV